MLSPLCYELLVQQLLLLNLVSILALCAMGTWHELTCHTRTTVQLAHTESAGTYVGAQGALRA